MAICLWPSWLAIPLASSARYRCLSERHDNGDEPHKICSTLKFNSPPDPWLTVRWGCAFTYMDLILLHWFPKCLRNHEWSEKIWSRHIWFHLLALCLLLTNWLLGHLQVPWWPSLGPTLEAIRWRFFSLLNKKNSLLFLLMNPIHISMLMAMKLIWFGRLLDIPRDKALITNQYQWLRILTNMFDTYTYFNIYDIIYLFVKGSGCDLKDGNKPLLETIQGL